MNIIKWLFEKPGNPAPTESVKPVVVPGYRIADIQKLAKKISKGLDDIELKKNTDGYVYATDLNMITNTAQMLGVLQSYGLAKKYKKLRKEPK